MASRTVRFGNVEISYERIAPAHWVFSGGNNTVRLKPDDAKAIAEQLDSHPSKIGVPTDAPATVKTVTMDGDEITLELSGGAVRSIVGSVLGK